MKHLPIGEQFFDILIKNNAVYVDKTKLIYELVTQRPSNAFYFLSRPRRFGKSLLISTLYHFFLGHKELFDNLWIADKISWDTHHHPVIWIDFNSLSYVVGDLEPSLARRLDEIAQEYSIELKPSDSKGKLYDLIQQLYENTGQQVVVLIDEYDKPLIDYLSKPAGEEKLAYHKDILKSFYAVLKSIVAQHIRFALITGVARVGKLPLFSDLNHLDDVSMDARYATLLGYTAEEPEIYFKPYIEEVAKVHQITYKKCLENIRHWYNGYSWDGKSFVYNPWSTLQLLSKKVFSNYWYETGTPTFLIQHLQKLKVSALDLEQYKTRQSLQENSDIDTVNVLGLLFQTGYLTIKEIEQVGLQPRYNLSYPNEEVRQSFHHHFLTNYLGENSNHLKTLLLDRMEEALKAQDVSEFMGVFQTVFAQIPYNLFLKPEAYYHTVVYLTLSLLGTETKAEIQTQRGRIDAILQYEEAVYVIEFKNTSAEEAMIQIKENKYYERFQHQGKRIFLLGVAFEEEKKGIGAWEAGLLSS